MFILTPLRAEGRGDHLQLKSRRKLPQNARFTFLPAPTFRPGTSHRFFFIQTGARELEIRI